MEGRRLRGADASEVRCHVPLGALGRDGPVEGPSHDLPRRGKSTTSKTGMEPMDLRRKSRAGMRYRGWSLACVVLALGGAIDAWGQSAQDDPLPPLPPVDPNQEPPIDWSAWQSVAKVIGVSQADITDQWSYTTDTARRRQSGQAHTTVFMELETLRPEELGTSRSVAWRVISANGVGTTTSSSSRYGLGGGYWLGSEVTTQGSYTGPLSLRVDPTLRFRLSDGVGGFMTLSEPTAAWALEINGSVTELVNFQVSTRTISDVQDASRVSLEHSWVEFTAPKAAVPFSARSSVDGPSSDGSGLGEGSFHRTASVMFWPDWNDVEVRVEIEDSTRPGAPYRDWRPEGNLESPDQGGPRPLRLKATLRPKAETPTPAQLAAMPPVRRFRFELADTSREPGVCMNWPSPAGSTFPKEDPEFDLRFIATIPQAMELSPRKQKAGVRPLPGEDPNLPSAWVLLECFDFGAHATVQVYADLADGRVIVGHMKEGEEKRYVIPIPDRPLGSLVAQKWREDFKVTGPDSEDADDQPTGDGQKGDGFSVYEEYRGFRTNSAHLSIDPAVKDLFVRNLNGGPVAAACRALEVKTSEGGRKGLKIHETLESDEWHDSRVMNPNRGVNSPRSSEERQHGLLVVPSTATGEAVISFADISRRPWRPKNTERVVVHPRDNTVETVAHEIAHAIGAQHHGDTDYHARWLVLEVPSADGTVRRRFFEQAMTSDAETGTLTPTGAPVPIRVFREGQSQETLPDASTNAPLPAPSRKFIARRGGQHSGHETCFMRYNAAAAYIPSGRPMDRITFPKTVVIDFSDGDIYTFCRACQGTGVNPARFGHATRGDCLAQLCVRDSAPERPAPTGKCANTP